MINHKHWHYDRHEGWQPIKARKLDVLKLIHDKEVVTAHDLMEEFSYRYSSARCRLHQLRKEGFIQPLFMKGQWGLTEKGYRKLDYHGMLKLLEEPPPHLVIIMATTHFEKIPDTISSRCQLYPFTKLKPEDIKRKLELISQREGISPDPKHIQFIVESSGGNMRSAENTLEQVCQIKGGTL